MSHSNWPKSSSCSRTFKASRWFYRTAAGAEMDLVLEWPGQRRWAIEVKRSLSPRLAKGFHQARADLQPERTFVVTPAERSFPMAGDAGLILSPLNRFGAILESNEGQDQPLVEHAPPEPSRVLCRQWAT